MQLFISTQFELNTSTVSVHDPRICHQCYRVLRMKTGDKFQIQNKTTRYTICLTTISARAIEGSIIDHEELLSTVDHMTTLFVALPNRHEKMELMVQKLTEIGIDHIVFWPARRSILKNISTNKYQRLQSIALEASEQSFRTTLPIIKIIDNLDKKSILGHDQVFVAYQGSDHQYRKIQSPKAGSIATIIGPEGGFDPSELETLQPYCQQLSLGSTILRTETAAIIAGRLLVNRR